MATERRALVETVGGVLLIVGIAVLGNGLTLAAIGAAVSLTAFVVVGGLLVVLGLAAQHRRLARLRHSPTFLMTLIVGAAAVLGLAALALVSVINFRHFRRVDLTGSELYRLNDQTLKVLKQVGRPLRIIGAMVPHPAPRTAIERFNNVIRARATAMLREYASQSRHIEFTELDIYTDPLARNRLEDEYQTEILRDSVTFVYELELGKRRTGRIAFSELATHAQSPDSAPQFRGEERFTSALQMMIEGAAARVCVVTDHGERSIEEFGHGGLSDLAAVLRNDNCVVRPCRLPDIPEGCTVLVIAGPRRAFVEAELDALRAYLAKGGGLIALIDPVVGKMARSGVEDVLREQGIAVASDVAIIEESRLRIVGGVPGRTPGVRIETADYPPKQVGSERQLHPIMREMKRIRTAYYLACPLVAVSKDGTKRDPHSVELVVTSARSSGKRGFEPGSLESLRIDRSRDPRGPFAIGIARGAWLPAGPDAPAEPAPSGRIVVFGDSDFIINGHLKQGSTGNLTLARNLVAWVGGREYKVGIPPKPLEMERRLDVTSREKALARWAAVIVPPFHILLIGIVVWIIRRR